MDKEKCTLYYAPAVDFLTCLNS